MLSVIVIAIMIYGELPVTSLFGWVESMFIWRSLIVPSFLDYEHIMFFSENPWYFWSGSQITMGLVEEPYRGVGMAQLIGLAVFNDASLQANTGFIGSGFAQAGLFGVVLYAAGAGIVLALCEGAASALGSRLVNAAMLTLVLTMFMSTDFVGMFLTHGLALAIVLLFTLNPPGLVSAATGGTGHRS